MTSLDEKHSELLTKFNENETIFIPKLVKEIATLKSQYQSLPKSQIELKLDIKDQVRNKTFERRKEQISPRQFPRYIRLFRAKEADIVW